MGSSDRRQREKESLRARILEAARELFVEQGYDAVTMRKIAEKIEYSPTAIYQHFADKQALLQELCASDFTCLAEGFQELAGIDDPLERLRGIGRAYTTFARDNMNQYRFMFMTSHPPGHDELKRADRGNPNRDSYTFLRWTVAQAIERGQLRPDLSDPDLAAQLVWGAMHGIIALQIAMKDDDWLEWRPLGALCEQMIDTLLRGITP